MKKSALVVGLGMMWSFTVNAVDMSVHIVNGNDADIDDFPSFASIYTYADFDDGTYYVGNRCGASILDAWHILTAAHCVSNSDMSQFSKEFTVVIPKLQNEASFDSAAEFNSTTKYWVDTIYVHSGYDADKVVNDIAILKLEDPLTILDADKLKISPDDAYTGVVTDAFIAVGHGRTTTNNDATTKLQKTPLKIYPGSPACGYGGNQPDTQLCMYSDNIISNLENATCSGDSGGPLYWTSGSIQYQVGLTSFGPADGCGNTSVNAATSVFTEINDYSFWISEILASRPASVTSYSTSETRRADYRQKYTASDGRSLSSTSSSSSSTSSSGGGSIPLWGLILLPFACILRIAKK